MAQAWTAKQRRKFKATMAERAALREVQTNFYKAAAQDKGIVLSQRLLVTEVKVGSEIAFTLGDMRLVIRAVE
jgi:hypothetical protein